MDPVRYHLLPSKLLFTHVNINPGKRPEVNSYFFENDFGLVDSLKRSLALKKKIEMFPLHPWVSTVNAWMVLVL